MEPVCGELDFEIGVFSAYSMIYGIAICAAIPFSRRVLERFRLRTVLTGASVMVSLTELCMGAFEHIYQWYIAAAIQGVCYALLVVLTVPMLMNAWFRSRKGFFIGLASISSGIIGAVFNSLAGRVIASFGWREGYMFLGLSLFVMLVPVSLLFSWKTPKEAGAEPYQRGTVMEKQSEERALLGDRRNRSIKIFIFAFSLFSCLTVGFNQVLSGLASSLGYEGSSLSDFVSVAMIGTIVCKLLIGSCIDALGIWKASLISIFGVLLGLVLLLFGDVPALLYMGSFLMGMPMAISVVLIQNMVRKIYGKHSFAKVYSQVSIGINLASNFSFSMIGAVLSLSSSYKAVIYLGSALTLMALLILGILYRRINGMTEVTSFE